MTVVIFANRADHKTGEHSGGHIEGHFSRTGQQLAEHRFDFGILYRFKGATGKFKEIRQHPSGNGRVVHHKEIGSGDGKPSVNVPFATGRL